MSETKSPPPDPFAAWKPFQALWMDAWAKAMSETVNSAEFAQAMGDYLDAYLPASEPMRKQMEKALQKYLQQLNLPSRNELASLAERLTQLELKADDLDAKLDEALEHLRALRAAAEAKPNEPKPAANKTTKRKKS